MQKLQHNSLLALALGMLLVLLFFTLTLKGQNMYKSNEILISFKEQPQTGENYSINAQSTDCTVVKTLNGLNTEVWCIPDTLTFAGDTVIGIENIIAYFESFVGVVKYAEPNHQLELHGVPNDSLYFRLWGMDKINMPEAWDTQEGSSDIIVGVLDSGIDWSHEDLKQNIWQNLKEDADGDGTVLEWTGTEWIFDPGDENGIDDDGNGYIDDFIGWDFYNNTNKPIDNCGHGTHVAGTIGAVGNNNIGVIGVSPNVKMMALKAFEPTPSGCYASSNYVSEIVEALNYATNMGATISNNSYGGPGYSQTFKDAIDLAGEQEHLFIASAGNDNQDADLTPAYPAAYNSPNIISVAATDEDDQLSVFLFPEASNFGATSVDLAAPGSGIYSTYTNNNYTSDSGTSMAAPHVAGAAALLKAQCDQLSYQDIKNAILESVDIITALEEKCVSGGRLNVNSALQNIPDDCQDEEPKPECLQTDSTALIALYNATNGPNWFNTWNLDQPVSLWYGLTFNEDGCVIGIDLSSNNLVGFIPNEMENIINLMDLRLSNNQLSGEIPEALGFLYNLNYLSLENNQLTGCYPHALCKAIIEVLIFTNNPGLPDGGSEQGFNDICSGPAECYACHTSDSLALVALYNATDGLNWTNTWDLNQPINSWYGLTFNEDGCVIEIDLNGNNLVGVIPSEIGDLASLTDLRLQNNELAGSIPAELGNLSNLVHLNIQNSLLSGDIPAELGNLTSLVELILNSNDLAGNIPAELGNISTLEVIALQFNELTGNIPVELGNLVNLEALVLYANQLSGNIPPQLGNLANLIELRLQDNQLTGDIPQELENLSNIQTLFLNDNLLTGCYPQQWCIFNILEFDFTNNDGLPDGGSNKWYQDFCGGIVACPVPPTPTCTNDSLALVAIYDATDGPNWTNTWNLNQPMSSWYGITLNNDGCVIEIYLNGNNLVGFIPSEIGDLANLTELKIQNNELNSNIPAEIGNLTNLTYLNIQNSQLTGNLPPEMGNLTSLEGLHLNSNNLDGNIPNTLGNLYNLVVVRLEFNEFTGNIPTELGYLGNLFTLNLHENNLTGNIPAELGSLSNLTNLRLQSNILSGEIPTELGNLDNLTLLSLNENQLFGCYPQSLCSLNLTDYDFSNNPDLPDGGTNQGFLDFCEGTAPTCVPFCKISAADSLALLDFYYSTDGLNWNNPWNLTLPINTWHGVVLDSSGCNIDFLFVGNNNLSGCYPQSLCNLNFINYDFENNPNLPEGGSNQWYQDFCEDIVECPVPPTPICTNDSLALVAIYNATDGPNWINTWDLNQPMSAWYGITLNNDGCVIEIDLNGNNLVGFIPNEIGDLTNLIELRIQNNELIGNIPAELGNLTNLTYLNIQNSQLTGNLPPEMGNLTSLEGLHLNSNDLTGNIPNTLGNLYNLVVVRLEFNEFTGNIPAELGYLGSLIKLNLHENNLTGDIPTELGSLSNLTNLRLQGNMLSGEIPTELGNLANLTILSLNENQLSGCYPLSLCNLNLEYYNFKDNIHLHDQGSDQGFLDICNGASCEIIPIVCEPFELDLGPDQDLSCGDTIILSTQFPNAGFIIWDYNGSVYAVNEESIGVYLPGTYIAVVTDRCGNVAIDTIQVYEGNSCVWPGDMDHNQTANYLDVLYWGLDYNKVGPPRINASTAWVGQAATDWDYTGPNDINDKHSDANGDGIVDEADLDVLTSNYGETYDNSFNATPSNASLSVQIDPEATSFANDTISMDINLNQNNSGIHGMAWQVDLSSYDSIKIDINAELTDVYSITNASFQYTNEWFGEENTEVHSFYNYNPVSHKLEISVTRIDGKNINANGLVGKVIVDIDHVGTWAKILENPETQNVKGGSIEDAHYINNQSEIFALNGNSTVTVAGTNTSTDTEPSNNIIQDVINLKAGWNLISFDVVPFSKKIEDVFTNLKPNNLEYVVGYNNGASLYTHNGNDVFNTLKEIETGYGYWVKVKEDDAVYTYGLLPKETSPKYINAGWNLTGFLSPNSYSPEIYYKDIIANENLVFVSGYDGQVLTFDPNKLDNNTLNTLKNGSGYWVKLNNAEEAGSTETNFLNSNIFDFLNGTSNLRKGEAIYIQSHNGSNITNITKIEVMAGGKIATIPIYGDDPLSTNFTEGILEGDVLSFIWNGQPAEVNVNFNGDKTVHTVDLKFKLSIKGNITETVLDSSGIGFEDRLVERLGNGGENESDDELETLAVLAYPNPVVDFINFEVNLLRPNEKLTIEIFNINGRLIHTLTETDLNQGINKFTCDLKELPIGRYIYRTNSNWNKRTDSFIKLK